MLRFFLLFIAIQASLFTLELLAPVQALLIQPWTAQLARFCAFLMQSLDADVQSQGIMLYSARTGFAVAIQAGCNGVEASIILIAALLAFPKVPVRYRVIGLLLGVSTVQLLNIVRIISLYYLGIWHQSWFDWAHLYLWETLIMLDVLVVFLLWLRNLPPRAPSEAVANAV